MTKHLEQTTDTWEIGGKILTSRLLIGSALYPSPANMEDAIKESEAQIVTVALRRQAAGENAGGNFWNIIKALNIHVLPNTAGCHSAKEAITTAQMAREVFGTNWIKLEVIGDQYNLQPDPFETVKAAEILIKEGFEVFPYTTDDLVVAKRLANVGCKIIMPWGSMIGSGKGLMNPDKNLYIDLIEKSFDRNYIQTPKQEALSYYYLLAAYLLDDNEQDYIVKRKKFDRFIEGHGKRITILRDLGPSWFEKYINLVSSDSQNALKISRLNEVWDKITQRQY